ncbi:MAG: ABC transporter permease [Clostridiales bacterium]|nr:ABC transporter permease [Clostridiales bacterium]
MFENIGLSFQGIWNHKLRSLLTMLGIIIGIASIIAIVSTIKGTNEQIKEQLIGAGNNVVTVQLNQNGYGYEFQYSDLPDGVPVISEQTRARLANLEGAEDATLYTERTYVDGLIYYQNTGFSGTLRGVDTHYFSVNGYQVYLGRDFAQSDYDDYKKVAILDQSAAESLFPGENPLGKTIEIRSEPFTVVGVVSLTSTYEPNISTYTEYYTYVGNDSGAVYIPGTCWQLVCQYDEPQTVDIQAATTDDMTSVGQAAAEVLNARLTVSQDSDLAYSSNDVLEQAEQLQQLANSTNQQLVWIASISLLVGGIGVMNITLVTVTERTREIGLKKAVGARKSRILWQFLTEAAVLTSLGGVIGVLVGIGMAQVGSQLSGSPTAVSVPSIILAVVFSMFIGILFGLMPAVKAANLNPIDALRRE